MNWLIVTFLFNILSLSFPDPIRFKYPDRFDYPNYARILRPSGWDSLVISIWIIDFSAHRNVVSKKGVSQHRLYHAEASIGEINAENC